MANLLKVKTIWLSMGLILLGIFMPKWVSPQNIGLDNLVESLEHEPTGNTLMISAFVLVIFNTVLMLPHYLGAFLLGDEIGHRLERIWLKTGIPLLIVPLVYFTIHSYYPMTYDFGGPALLLLLSIFLLQKLDKYELKPAMKALILSQLLVGVQWLDLVPLLSGYGFGRGTVPATVKESAIQIGFDAVLSLYGITMCMIFVINAVILAIFLVLFTQKWTIRQTLHLAQLEAMESRSDREVLHLIHDLKTPLTTIEGLISLIEMRVNESKIKEYCSNISTSIRSMSDMISEILYESRKSWCRLDDVLNYVGASRLSGTKVTFDMEMPVEQNLELWINKVRVTRALVNLIDNALDAIEGKPSGHVMLRAQIHGSEIWLGVSDNGPGILIDDREKVWQAGYSTKGHLGVGLSFVRQVAEGHGAYITIDSEIGRGTTVWLHFQGGNESE